ncbi:heparan N-sulfatase [Lentisphaera araneosa HTCC2155]|uniref:Heparan N-sulfatase n=2 Tax=Lentisphaera TaxID=256846 RepID=A6DPC4_9BACT|nr:heparan N-sulfatase [Lentisphaera araneosa HTCC2155]
MNPYLLSKNIIFLVKKISFLVNQVFKHTRLTTKGSFMLLQRLLILSLLLLGFNGFSNKSERPNIILITADDLSWDSLGCMGNPIEGLTPNLDKMASDGLIIEHCFISTPICGPSRTALYTGRHPHTSGYMGHGVQPPTWWRKNGGKFPKKSITSELHKSGYLTGIVGKHGTSVCKFDEKFCDYQQTGFGRDHNKYSAFVKDFLARAKKENKPFYLAANTHDPHHYWPRSKGENKRWFDQGMRTTDWKAYENGKPYPDPLTQYKPEEIVLPASYPDDINFKKEATLYFDGVNRMDQIIGGILKELDESGMADNTLVIFLSDHGMPWQMGKWSLYPSGTRTPLLMRWPAQIKPGRREKNAIVSAVDIAPTLAEICGINAIKATDGKSFADLAKTENSKWNRNFAFSTFNYMNNNKPQDQLAPEYSTDLYQKTEQYRPSRALNNTRFSYVWNGWADGDAQLPKQMGGAVSHLLNKHSKNQLDKNYPDYKKRAKFMKFRAPEELYDIVKDPGCRNNLAKNPEYRPVLEKIRKNMIQLLKETQDHELENYVNSL